MPRNTSTHAAGVVITKLPVYDYVPLATNDGTIVTEYTLSLIHTRFALVSWARRCV